MKYIGIDYGLGQSNIDKTTGNRYGVININSLNEFINDELEPVYPETDKTEEQESDYMSEPIGFTLANDTYTAESAFDDSCLFLIKSPYYTYCMFCSPCAPGAGDLDNPIENGVPTLCFGHEMFDNDKAPYPVYSAKTNELVLPANK